MRSQGHAAANRRASARSRSSAASIRMSVVGARSQSQRLPARCTGGDRRPDDASRARSPPLLLLLARIALWGLRPACARARSRRTLDAFQTPSSPVPWLARIDLHAWTRRCMHARTHARITNTSVRASLRASLSSRAGTLLLFCVRFSV